MENKITNRYWREIVKSAARRDIAFHLTPEEAWRQFIIQDGKCALTGERLDFDSHRGYRGNASLDRIVNENFYIPHNVWWVLGDINVMKKDHPLNHFIRLCHLVANKNKKIAIC